MKMVVPHILITRWPIMLASGDPLAPKGIPHRMRQVTRGSKEVDSKVVWNIQHVLVVTPRNHQTVTFYSCVVVGRNQSEHVVIHQDNG